MSMNIEKIKQIIEASLLAAGSSLSKDRIVELFAEDEKVKVTDVTKALDMLKKETEGRGIELVEVATGFRYQARQDYAEWIARLWEERPSRYSRALLETLSLIAYRQPTTRSDIEQVRGVGVSSSIVKTLLEREWVRVVGHRDVPGKPALYATTKQFLDYFGLKSLDELPSLAEIKDLDNLNPELQFDKEDENSAKQSEEGSNESSEPSSDEASDDETGHERTVSESSAEHDELAESVENTVQESLDCDIQEQDSETEEKPLEQDENFDEDAQSSSDTQQWPDDELSEQDNTDDDGSVEGEEESDSTLKPTELH